MMLKLLVMISLCVSSISLAQGYRRATEGSAAVRGKLYTKRKRIEINGPDVGFIMNQSFVTTMLVHGGLTYYTSEEFGWQLEGSFGINSDKAERECIENFFNNPSKIPLDVPCNDESVVAANSNDVNWGPAYVPIREPDLLLAGNMVWAPVYGKQLLFLSSVIHFDLFVTAGGGLAMSTFYEKLDQVVLANGSVRPSRTPNEGATGTTPEQLGVGCPLGDVDCYGINGRPEAQSQTHPFVNLGVGQKLHINKLMHVKLELRNMTLLGTHSGFENLLALWGGVGFRF